MARPVVHVEVRGLESDRLRDFYEEVFGWRRNEELSIGNYSVAELGEGLLTAGIGPSGDATHGRARFRRKTHPRLHNVLRPCGQPGRTRRDSSGLIGHEVIPVPANGFWRRKTEYVPV